jgi:hypothetical protein
MDTNWWELQRQASYKRQTILQEAHLRRLLSEGDGDERALMSVIRRISRWTRLFHGESSTSGAHRALPDGRGRDIVGAPSSWSTEMR